MINYFKERDFNQNGIRLQISSNIDPTQAPYLDPESDDNFISIFNANTSRRIVCIRPIKYVKETSTMLFGLSYDSEPLLHKISIQLFSNDPKSAVERVTENRHLEFDSETLNILLNISALSSEARQYYIDEIKYYITTLHQATPIKKCAISSITAISNNDKSAEKKPRPLVIRTNSLRNKMTASVVGYNTGVEFKLTPNTNAEIKGDTDINGALLTFTCIPHYDSDYIRLLSQFQSAIDEYDNASGMGIKITEQVLSDILRIIFDSENGPAEEIDEEYRSMVLSQLSDFFTSIGNRYPDSDIVLARIG